MKKRNGQWAAHPEPTSHMASRRIKVKCSHSAANSTFWRAQRDSSANDNITRPNLAPPT